MQILSNILAFLFAVGIIIFVHELGHYLVAKAFNVRVLTFSLGFGRRLWSFRRGDTEYRLAAVPLGGYVAFSGHDPMEPTTDERDFLAQKRWQRVMILLAGPAMNVVLSIALVALVFMVGIEVVNDSDHSTEVGAVFEGSPAEEAGLLAGDVIVRLDGRPVETWADISGEIMISPEREMAVEYERGGQSGATTLVPVRVPRYDFGTAGLLPVRQPWVDSVVEGSPAARAGLERGDALRAVDGQPVGSVPDFRNLVGPKAGETVVLEIDRRGETLSLELIPDEVNGEGVVGVYLGIFDYQRFGPLQAVKESAVYNWRTAKEIFAFLGKLFERRVSPQSALSGPIEIARFSGQEARRGFRNLLFLMAIISLNLCIFNLLPIPLLDGGQILILLIESTIRRDLSLAFKARVTQLGLVLIVAMMAMALYFDLMKNVPPLFETDAATEAAPDPGVGTNDP